jgi:hypothetical protein
MRGVLPAFTGVFDIFLWRSDHRHDFHLRFSTPHASDAHDPDPGVPVHCASVVASRSLPATSRAVPRSSTPHRSAVRASGRGHEECAHRLPIGVPPNARSTVYAHYVSGNSPCFSWYFIMRRRKPRPLLTQTIHCESCGNLRVHLRVKRGFQSREYFVINSRPWNRDVHKDERQGDPPRRLE